MSNDSITDQLHTIYRSLPCEINIDFALMSCINVLHTKYPLRSDKGPFTNDNFKFLRNKDYFNSDPKDHGTYDPIK